MLGKAVAAGGWECCASWVARVACLGIVFLVHWMYNRGRFLDDGVGDRGHLLDDIIGDGTVIIPPLKVGVVGLSACCCHLREVYIVFLPFGGGLLHLNCNNVRVLAQRNNHIKSVFRTTIHPTDNSEFDVWNSMW